MPPPPHRVSFCVIPSDRGADIGQSDNQDEDGRVADDDEGSIRGDDLAELQLDAANIGKEARV